MVSQNESIPNRVTVDLGDDQAAALESLSRRLGMSKVDLMRRGFGLLQRAVLAASRGEGIGIVNSGHVVSELVGPWSEVQKERA